MATKYSKIYRGESKHQYRYNYEESQLEWISKEDLDEDCNIVKLSDWQVVETIGLNAENWRSSPQGYVDQWDDELREELGFLMSDL